MSRFIPSHSRYLMVCMIFVTIAWRPFKRRSSPMSHITTDFVAALARVWHRFDPPGQDMETLAEMLAPMDDAGEDMSHAMDFDMEPSD